MKKNIPKIPGRTFFDFFWGDGVEKSAVVFNCRVIT